MEKLIEVKGLKKYYGSIKAVDNIDLDVYRGDVFGFLGPNGAGKSTTIRMLLTLIKPTDGNILIFGKDLSKHRSEILRRIGCIVEKPDFYRYLTAKQNLSMMASLSGVTVKDSRIEEVLEFVGLRDRGAELVKGYSHGMKQRLGLAQALVHDPELIILDEPTTGLDPQGIIDIRNLILHLSNDLKKTIFLSSHILSELELIATRMAIINKGKTVAQGELKIILNDENRIVTIKTNRQEEIINLVSTSSWKVSLIDYSNEGLRFKLHLDQIPLLNNFLVEKGFLIYAIESRRQLEDFFLKITESAERMHVKI